MSAINVIWVKGDQMYTGCQKCGDDVPLNLKLSGSYDGVTHCPTCNSMYYVYVESRGWDIDVFDSEGMPHAAGEFQV